MMTGGAVSPCSERIVAPSCATVAVARKEVRRQRADVRIVADDQQAIGNVHGGFGELQNVAEVQRGSVVGIATLQQSAGSGGCGPNATAASARRSGLRRLAFGDHR